MTSTGGPEPAIVVSGLRMAYGDHEAVRGIDLRVGQGEVVALLGPNGAGKTTTLEILEGYRTRTGGEALVLGADPARRDTALLGRIGICLQATGIERYLTCAEVLTLYGGYYPRPRPAAELLELVGLAEQATTRVRRLSGGQRRRLDLALALVGDPELLFLDEPTTGFDPEARRQAWELVRGLVGSGRTVLLSTHFMDEAQALAKAGW
ncbi:MAG: ABC transporter ATP-binding protein [Chloroflexota bacterium]